MRVLVVTSEWPEPEFPNAGVFVLNQVKALRDLGVAVDVLNFRARRNLARYCQVLMQVRQVLRENVYDLVHAHFGQAGFVCTLQNQVPVVVTFHGSDLFGLPGTSLVGRFQSHLLKLASRIAARRATEVIFVSERLAKELSWRSGHVIPMGTDVNLFRPISQEEARKSLGWPMGERSVLFVGDPSNPIKRYDLAKEAVKRVAQSMPNVNLRVCWNEPQERVPVYMNAADVLIVTSIHESGPLVVREAAACNLPIVSVDVGDVRQRIGSIEGCVLCEDDRPETITAGLAYVLERGYRSRGRLALADLEERHLAEKLLDVYALATSSFAER